MIVDKNTDKNFKAIVAKTGDGPKPAGGVSRGAQEYILLPNTAYVLLLTNTTAAANAHLLEMDWYEHTDKGV